MWRVNRLGLLCLLVSLWAFAPTSALASGEYESNDLRDTAFGPLSGGVEYTATYETDNDVDWYLFYVKTYSQMDFSATSIGSSCAYFDTYMSLYDKDGESLDSIYFGALNETQHRYLTLSPGRYYLATGNDDCTTHRYRFRIDPAASITTSRECGEAIVARDSIVPQLAKTNEELLDNGEDLARATAAVKRAGKTLRRLQKQPRASSYSRRAARRRLAAARKSREAVVRTRSGIQSAATQQQQALSAAEGTIAATC
jgi:hypothetical protein